MNKQDKIEEVYSDMCAKYAEPDVRADWYIHGSVMTKGDGKVGHIVIWKHRTLSYSIRSRIRGRVLSFEVYDGHSNLLKEGSCDDFSYIAAEGAEQYREFLNNCVPYVKLRAIEDKQEAEKTLEEAAEELAKKSTGKRGAPRTPSEDRKDTENYLAAHEEYTKRIQTGNTRNQDISVTNMQSHLNMVALEARLQGMKATNEICRRQDVRPVHDEASFQLFADRAVQMAKNVAADYKQARGDSK